MREPGGPSLDPDTRWCAASERASESIGQCLVVPMSLEAGIRDLIGDGDLLHCARDERHLALGRHQEEMRREVAPMVETGQIENVLRRGEQDEVEPSLRHRMPDGAQPEVVFRSCEVGRGYACHGNSR